MKRPFLTCLFLSLLTFLNSPLLTQQADFKVDNYTVSDGLANNSVYCIFQDYQGFLWVGTAGGLHKYDGYTFVVYKHNSRDSSSIPDNIIYMMYEDHRKRLWIGTSQGLSRYLRERNSFRNYELPIADPYAKFSAVYRIFENKDSTLHVLFPGQHLFQLDARNDTLVARNFFRETMQRMDGHNMRHQGNGIYKTRITFPDWTFADTLQYKYVINRADGTIQWEPLPDREALMTYGNRSLHLEGGEITLSTVSFDSEAHPSTAAMTLKKISRKNQQLQTVVEFSVDTENLSPPLSPGDTLHLRGNIFPLSWDDDYRFKIRDQSPIFTETKDGTIWAGMMVDHYWWYSSKQFIKKIKRNSGKVKRYMLTEDPPLHLFLDRSDIIWVGSRTKGLYRLDHQALKFPHYIGNSGKPADFYGKNIRSICEDHNGNIWLGGNLNGLYRINRKAGEQKFYQDWAGVTVNNSNLTSGTLNDATIYSIYEARNGSIWISTESGLNCLDPERKQFSYYFYNANNKISNIDMGGIYEDRQGYFWIGANALTLLRLDPPLISPKPNVMDPSSSDHWEVYSKFEENADWYREGEINDIIEDEKGYLWLGASQAGLLRFDRASGLLKGFKKSPGDHRTVSSLLIDRNGVLWYGTLEDGLIRFDRENHSEVQISEAKGLLHNSVMGLEEDNNGNLWISSLRGLTCYNPEENTFRHYSKNDGLQDNVFGFGAHFKSRNGELFFGGAYGFNAFFPDSLKEQSYDAPIVLTDIKINNRAAAVGKNETLQQHISVASEISLAYNQNDITLTFAELDYQSTGSNLYTFMLENYETEWRTVSKERTAYYTNLDPGEYVFRARACFNNGIAKAAEASVRITISPPWWRTIWAYLLYAFAFAALLFGLRRYELNRQQLRHQVEIEKVETRKLKEIDQMRSRFFANISHEFRTPLTLILAPLESWLKDRQLEGGQRKQFQMMHRNGARLLQLINQLLDLAKLEAGGERLQTSRADVIGLLRRIFTSFATAGDQKNIRMMFNDAPLISEAGHTAIHIYHDADKLEKVFVNILSNAFKFTPASGEISVAVSVHDGDEKKLPNISAGFVEIIFANTGPGIPAAALPHVFDRFFQADESETRNYEGTGIGLALAKELVEMHHGDISVESSEHELTTFTVCLPMGRSHLSAKDIVEEKTKESDEKSLAEQTTAIIDDDETQSTTAASHGDSAATNSNNMEKPLLLVVEDHQDLRTFIRDQLAGKYTVIEAENGKLGWEKATEVLPDVIISDVMMPEMDGYELCNKVKNDRKTSHIPVILLTARASRQDKMTGLETGADDYLVKPFDAEELKIRVTNLVNQRRQMREKFSTEMLLKPSEIAMPSMEQQFIEQLTSAIETNIDNENFGVEELGAAVGLSRSQLYRKLQAISDQSPRDFIRRFRLERAASLIRQNAGNMAEITYMVGFNSQAYFTRCFQDAFQCSPTEYRRAHRDAVEKD